MQGAVTKQKKVSKQKNNNTESMRSSRAQSIDSKDDEGRHLSSEVSRSRLTLCIVGSGGVGKSSLTVRYLHGHFPEVGSDLAKSENFCK